MVGIFLLVGLIMPAAIIGLIVWLIIRSRRLTRERSQKIHRGASERGRGFTHRVPWLKDRWASKPFRRGSSRTASNAVTWTAHGRSFIAFDYSYTVGSNDHRKTYRHQIIAITLPAPLPTLQLTPEGPGAGLADFFGRQDIRLESDEFNDTWQVKGPDGQYAFDFLHPLMMQRLLAADARGLTIVVEGTDIYVAVPDLIEIERYDYFANLLYGIYNLIPRHLWLRVGHDPGTVSR